MKETICITLVLLAFSVLAYSKEPEVITQNSFFEDGLENWEFILSGGALAEAEIDDSDSVKGSQCAYLDPFCRQVASRKSNPVPQKPISEYTRFFCGAYT